MRVDEAANLCCSRIALHGARPAAPAQPERPAQAAWRDIGGGKRAMHVTTIDQLRGMLSKGLNP